MSYTFNTPINTVSFGQISIRVLKEIYKMFDKETNINIFNIGNVSVSNEEDPNFLQWLNTKILESTKKYSFNDPCFKLWHLSDSTRSYSRNTVLLTFYELDSPTREEVNIANNNHTFVTNRFTQQVFSDYGSKIGYIPLFFDSEVFKKLDEKPFVDDRICFTLMGKFEKRKHHKKVIQSWVKKFGNNRKYFLNCALFNVHMTQEENNASFADALGTSEVPFNVNFCPYMQSNADYNRFLNSASIALCMSGGEGWGLPEFHSVGIGKHAVVLNAHGYREWANEDNATLISPSGKISAVDGRFFKPGGFFNQGNIFDFSEDEFIAGCEKAIQKYESNPVNEAGLLLQEKFPVEKTVSIILSELNQYID